MAQRGFRPTPQQRRRHQNEGMNQSVFRRAGQPKPPGAPKPPATAKPGLGKGPAPAPAPPAPTGKSRTPDSQYHGAVDRIARQEESRLGQLEGQEQAVKHEFGIDDPTNPFSRAEGLKRAFLARQKAASASLASQGQGYSGAHERALSRTRREEEQARSELRKSYEGAIGQIGAEKAGVKFATEEERAQAFEDWLARTPDSEAGGQTLSPGTGGVVTPVKQLTGERTVDHGSTFKAGPGGTTTEMRRLSTTLGDNYDKSGRLADLRGMLTAAQKRGDKQRVKVIQNRIKVVKAR